VCGSFASYGQSKGSRAARCLRRHGVQRDALLLTRFLGSMLDGLKPTDPLTLAGAGLLLFTIAILAGWEPVRRRLTR
jgi:type II secretory pathway component PulM